MFVYSCIRSCSILPFCVIVRIIIVCPKVRPSHKPNPSPPPPLYIPIGVSNISLTNESSGLSPISRKKNRWSKHFKLIDRSAGNRSSSCANRPSSPGCSDLQWSSRHAYTFSRNMSISFRHFSPRISARQSSLVSFNLN